MIGIQALTGLNPKYIERDPNVEEILWQHQVQVSAGLASVLTKMVRSDFKDRYKSATETLRALQQHPLEPMMPALAKEEKGRDSVLSPENYSRLEKILVELVGTVAPTLLQQVAVKVSSPNELVENLALHLTGHQRIAFEKRGKLFLRESTAQSQTNSNNLPGLKNQAINESFVRRCEQELADLIGPIATFLVQRTLKSRPQISPAEFVETLSAEIPAPQKALEFQQRLYS